MSGVTADYRPDTGMNNGQLGMYLFLAADAMFFGALLSSHVFLRTAAGAEWPKGYEFLPWVHGVVAAVLLVTAAIACRPKRRANGPWVAAFLSVLAAMVLLRGEYSILSRGHTAATDNFYGMFYLFTLVFRAHIVTAALITAWIGASYYVIPESIAINRVARLGTLWRFLAVVWIVILAVVYAL